MEVAITTLLVAATVGMVVQRNQSVTASPSVDTLVLPEDDVVDLPCPWCEAQTGEDDASCPSCGQPFG